MRGRLRALLRCGPPITSLLPAAVPVTTALMLAVAKDGGKNQKNVFFFLKKKIQPRGSRSGRETGDPRLPESGLSFHDRSSGRQEMGGSASQTSKRVDGVGHDGDSHWKASTFLLLLHQDQKRRAGPSRPQQYWISASPCFLVLAAGRARQAPFVMRAAHLCQDLVGLSFPPLKSWKEDRDAPSVRPSVRPATMCTYVFSEAVVDAYTIRLA